MAFGFLLHLTRPSHSYSFGDGVRLMFSICLDWWETSDGGHSVIVAAIVITVTVAGIVIMSVLLWRRRDDARLLTTAETVTIAENLIATDDRADDDKTDKKFALLPQQQLQEHCRNVYPNLCPSRNLHRQSRGTAGYTPNGTAVDTAPDIMIQPSYGKQFYVSIASHGIPGPESSV